ncbi:heme ABC exporter ATP-binding protein CcmA [Glaciecola sp. MH2013]|nr:heme ABC exporter ATP-binding protein CcmA [Glaciecola sp. MH2013]
MLVGLSAPARIESAPARFESAPARVESAPARFESAHARPESASAKPDDASTNEFTQGRVEINGTDVHSNTDQASEKLLYFGHKQGVSQLLTPVENLMSWCKLHNIVVSEADIITILGELGLTGLEDLPLKNLSAGQQRRVSLAKLWLKTHANLWVLDEPFTALDVNLIASLENKIREFLQSGGAVLMTSHQALNIDHPITNMHLEYQW